MRTWPTWISSWGVGRDRKETRASLLVRVRMRRNSSLMIVSCSILAAVEMNLLSSRTISQNTTEEGEEDEEDEEEGSDGSPVTGWEEDEDEYGPDEGQGLSWVQQAREMAEQEAAEMSLRVVDARWTRGKLVFKVEHLNADLFAVGIEECERMSKSLGFRLDAAPFMLDRPYNLVVSTPGAKDVLTRDREFAAFKGFPVTVTTKEPYKNKIVFEGNLHV
mmetsp:Transcript_25836/g.58194  ORF Transcript_25836/g.58194 Transcript_25836/m.58194 type:complete len:219 (+) Transcript_25836:371-1027(+)